MGGLGYTFQTGVPVVLIGTKSGISRTGVSLTGSYLDTYKIFNTGGMAKLNLNMLYQLGNSETANTLLVKLESSADGNGFYQLVNGLTVGGTTTVSQRESQFLGATATNPYALSLPIDVSDVYMKISFAESGVSSNAGNVYAEVTVSGSK